MKEIKSMMENSLKPFLYIYKYKHTLHHQKQKTRRLPDTKIYRGVLGLIK